VEFGFKPPASRLVALGWILYSAKLGTGWRLDPLAFLSSVTIEDDLGVMRSVFGIAGN